MPSRSRKLSEKAELFAAVIAEKLDTKQAENSNSWFLIGRSLLATEGFNKVNTDTEAPLHGFGVIYGPFDTKAAAHEFVADYNGKPWPGDNDWMLVRPGKPFLITEAFDEANTDVVHNKSLEFQGQVMMNRMQERAEEIERAQKEEDVKPAPVDPEARKRYLLRQEARVAELTEELEVVKKSLEVLKSEE